MELFKLFRWHTFVMVFLDFYSHTHLVESKFIYTYLYGTCNLINEIRTSRGFNGKLLYLNVNIEGSNNSF